MAKIQQNSGNICFVQKICENLEKKTAKNSAIFNEKIEIRERCKGVHCVDLGESFPTSIYLQTLASIQPRTSLVKIARSPRTDPPGLRSSHNILCLSRPRHPLRMTGARVWRRCGSLRRFGLRRSRLYRHPLQRTGAVYKVHGHVFSNSKLERIF